MRGWFAFLAATGCFSPHPHAGAQCGDNNACPDGLVCAPATQTCELTAGSPIDGALGADAPDAVTGVDASTSPFAFRRRVTITNNTATALPVGYTIRVPLAGVLHDLLGAGKVQADYADLRVIGDGSLGERDRIVDPDGGPAPDALSFSLAAALPPNETTTSYALYYGSPAAGPAPADGTQVFTLYDDFASGLASFWLVNDTAAVSNGKLVLHADHLDAIATTATTDKLPIVSEVELIARVVDPTSDPTTQPDGTFYYWWGYQRTGDFSPVTDPWVVWIARGKSGIGVEQKSPGLCIDDCEPTPGTQTPGRHYYAVDRDPGETRFVRDTAAVQTITVDNGDDYSVMVRNFLATSDIQVDYVRARARVSPDPSVMLGDEENL